jgi:hypothetical protein
MIIEPQFDYVHDFSEGVAEVRYGDFKTGKVAFIDAQGKLLSNPDYETESGLDSQDYDLKIFKEGMAKIIVLNGNKKVVGFITKTTKNKKPKQSSLVSY